MLYTEFKVKDKEYKAVLNASAIVEAEKKLGENPLNVLVRVTENNLPSFESLMIILHASLQKYQHGVTMKEVYDLYDDFVEEGHELADLLPIITNIFEVSGFFKQQKEEDNSKN